MIIFKMMKNKINRSDLTNTEVVDSLKEQIDVFYAGDRITLEQYNTLINMLPEENNIEDITIE